ncbi:CoA transferase [Actinoplanes sp. NBRC 103695]|uniref:CaiB/BaiF CoA transferase family protein n=1 Tax=Actinoplanes sp. NBRC 103695 TaxID=3032202 RepID=UPI0024A2CE14|nr:CoA transferase [Actinoplanes sp. NBRC 103695]GLY97773.1 hypothetical protein Acsp02_50270 [Actinoplanes sp. NBRC 103695]
MSEALDRGMPLQDVRVIELGQLPAGPFCGQLMGDFGAVIIKVEDPKAGDPMRQWGREKPYGRSLWWPVVARNKKSVTADLRSPEGQDLVRKLAAKADVLLENFRPGTLERWNLSPERLWEINPRLIVTRVTGYGQTGPYAFGADELLDALHQAGVPAGRIYKAGDMFADPHFAAREAIVTVPDAELGDLPMQSVFPKLSATPGKVRSTGPALGSSNDEIYRGLLGLGDDDLGRLSAAGVI